MFTTREEPDKRLCHFKKLLLTENFNTKESLNFCFYNAIYVARA